MVAAVFGLVAGPIGAVGGVLAGAVWVLGTAAYAVVVGALAVWIAGGQLADPLAATGVLVGLGLIIAIDCRHNGGSSQTVLAMGGWTLLGLGGLVAGLAAGGPLGAVVGILITGLAAGYLVHRIDVVITQPTEVGDGD